MIRPATDTDLAEVLAIYNHAIEHTNSIFEYRPHTMDMRHEWFRSRQAASLPVLVADDDGRVVGFASYGPFRGWPAY